MFLPESPKYLYDQKRYKECSEVLKLMSKINRGAQAETKKIDSLQEMSTDSKIN